MKNNSSLIRMMRGIGMLSLLILPFLTSCLDEGESHLDRTPVAYVSFYHGSPATSALSITVDSKLYNTNPFNYSTYFDYGNFYTGERNFSFKSVNGANSLLDTTVTFEAEKTYSFFISEEEGGFVPIIVEDELTTPGAGKALIRMIHLSPDAPTVNLQLGEGDEDLFEEQSYQDVTDFVEVSTGRLDFILNDSADGEAVVTAENIEIRENYIYTLVVRGYADPAASTANALSLQLVRNYPNY